MGDSKDASDLVDKPGFIQHVFNFSEDGKAELLNIMQYSLLSIVPVIILNKCIQKFVPEADDTKGSAEILAELIFQVLAMFVGLVFINRAITYVPTYSGTKYNEINLLGEVLAFMMILLSLQTKIGEKANILLERLADLWDGTGSSTKKETNAQAQNPAIPMHQPSQADALSAAALGIMPQGPPGIPDALAAQPPQHAQQAQMPAQGLGGGMALPDAPEPVAANEMGGGMFSSLF
jgi:hypothetical protein